MVVNAPHVIDEVSLVIDVNTLLTNDIVSTIVGNAPQIIDDSP